MVSTMNKCPRSKMDLNKQPKTPRFYYFSRNRMKVLIPNGVNHAKPVYISEEHEIVIYLWLKNYFSSQAQI